MVKRLWGQRKWLGRYFDFGENGVYWKNANISGTAGRKPSIVAPFERAQKTGSDEPKNVRNRARLACRKADKLDASLA